MAKKAGKGKHIEESNEDAGSGNNEAKNKDFLKGLAEEEKIVIERIKELIGLLKTKHRISTKDIIYLTDDKETLIPVSIFTKELRILEALTKYLKEELDLTYHQIGMLLNRDERNIWQTYKRADKKHPSRLKVQPSRYFIPASIFQNKLSVLENIAVYLKDELNLSYHAIAQLLERDDRTIWTMYNRGKKKIKR